MHSNDLTPYTRILIETLLFDQGDQSRSLLVECGAGPSSSYPGVLDLEKPACDTPTLVLFAEKIGRRNDDVREELLAEFGSPRRFA